MIDVIEWVRREQEILWNDLGDAIRTTVNGTWSIHAANLARRIVSAARLVGPTPYGSVPWSMLAGGVYEAVLDAGDLTPELPVEAEWQRLDDLMSRHGTTRATERLRYADTVAAINTGRERNWIGGGSE